MTKIVSPSVIRPVAAVAIAAQPARAPAAGPAANPSNVHAGRSIVIGSSSDTPARSTSAADEAPTSIQRSSIVAATVSARCCCAK
jgi:hypothetical protein